MSTRSALSAVWRFVRSHAVLSVSLCAALVSMAFVPPDDGYASYIDTRTIACLFCILAVAGALKRLGAFERAARFVVRRFSSSRSAILSLVGATAILSMFATNDMALIMMLPLAAATLVRAGWVRYLPFTFVMQALVANLGGMIMPFGNPQNLYLYSFYEIGLADFLGVMAMPFAVSMILSVGCCMYVLRNASPAAAVPNDDADGPIDMARLLTYLLLFAASVAMVLRVIPAYVVVIAVIAVLALLDRGALAHVDYALLATFLCFFVFAGNMSRIPAVDDLLGGVVGSLPLLVSAGLSQVISNVPSAVLLSHFTDAWQPLLVGVNIGGAGTFVGSLASLISLQQYGMVSRLRAVRCEPEASMKRFVATFCRYNVAFLFALVVICSFVGW